MRSAWLSLSMASDGGSWRSHQPLANAGPVSHGSNIIRLFPAFSSIHACVRYVNWNAQDRMNRTVKTAFIWQRNFLEHYKWIKVLRICDVSCIFIALWYFITVWSNIKGMIQMFWIVAIETLTGFCHFLWKWRNQMALLGTEYSHGCDEACKIISQQWHTLL